MPLALHIFENRYQALIRNCLSNGQQFGVIYRSKECTQQIGCCAQVTDVIREFDDGCLDIVVTGTRRFKIHYIYQEKSDQFILAQVSYYHDRSINDTKLVSVRNTAIQKLEEIIYLSKHNNIRGVELHKMPTFKISFIVATLGLVSMAQQQELLKMRSLLKRLYFMIEILNELVLTYKVIDRLAVLDNYVHTNSLKTMLN